MPWYVGSPQPTSGKAIFFCAPDENSYRFLKGFLGLGLEGALPLENEFG
jgi:hypothetical protein